MKVGEHTERGSAKAVWRNVLLPLLAISTIVGVIVFLELRPSNEGDQNALAAFDTGDVSFGPTSDARAEIGREAPGFVLVDLDGQPVSLTDFAGKTVLINFWASWCVPCRTEMPDLEEAYEERAADGLVVLGVNLREASGPAREFATRWGITFPVLLDLQGDVADAYRLSGLPESWIVGPDGTLVRRKIGAFTSIELQIMLDEVMSANNGSKPGASPD